MPDICIVFYYYYKYNNYTISYNPSGVLPLILYKNDIQDKIGAGIKGLSGVQFITNQVSSNIEIILPWSNIIKFHSGNNGSDAQYNASNVIYTYLGIKTV